MTAASDVMPQEWPLVMRIVCVAFLPRCKVVAP
jgi:hypothetical protein